MKIYKCLDLDACGLKHDLHNYFIKVKIAAKIDNGKEIKDAFINTSLIDPELFDDYTLEYKQNIFDVYLETEGIVDDPELFSMFQETLDLDNYSCVRMHKGGYDNLVKVYLTNIALPYCLIEKDTLRNIKKTMKDISERALKNNFVWFNTIEYNLYDSLANIHNVNSDIKIVREYLAEYYDHSSYSDEELLEFGKICSLIKETNKIYRDYSSIKSDLTKEINNCFDM